MPLETLPNGDKLLVLDNGKLALVNPCWDYSLSDTIHNAAALAEQRRETRILADADRHGLPVGEARRIYALSSVPAASDPAEAQPAKKSRPVKRRRPRTLTSHRTLTDAELRAMHAVAENHGNVSAAARQLGKDRTTVREQYGNCLRKLGKSARREYLDSIKTKRLPTDHRGQATVADES